MRRLYSLVIASVAAWTLFANFTSQAVVAEQPAWGKSHHGSHYDVGPRARPWVMDGIGKTHFPITSSHPEVQQWFDQGHTLLHSFWPFEAERAFRWCLKLDPECAMAYWGLARCAQNDISRERRFFREAVKRKESVTPRERAYIEVWEAKFDIKGKGTERTEAIREYMKRFDNLLIDYPDDIEARALYWLEVPQATRVAGTEVENQIPFRYAFDRVLQEVLSQDPDHVGALHYRVHNWDGEEGHYALDTCLTLSKVAPNCGHLQHMPGHVLSGIGLWHEAAIAMDAATRVEKDYMRKRMVLPEQNWDYIHNLDYLAYIQEQLGMQEAVRFSCQQLLNGPEPTEISPVGNPANWALVRQLVKFEQWEDILRQPPLFRWNEDGVVDPALRAYAQCHAFIGLGRLDEAAAELQEFETQVAIVDLPKRLSKLISSYFAKKPPRPTMVNRARTFITSFLGGQPNGEADEDAPKGFIKQMIAIKRAELRGKLLIAQGKVDEGIRQLQRGAKIQYDHWRNDPPLDAVFLYNTLGEVYLGEEQFAEAAQAFEKTLEKVFNDGFALSGRVVALHALERDEEAAEALARLQSVWESADRPNRWLEGAEATGIEVGVAPAGLVKERNYQETVLARLGPSVWSPPMAPKLWAQNTSGEMTSLDEFRGKNVIMIFYLGGQCLHCMEQLQEAEGVVESFEALNTKIIAISRDDVATNREYEETSNGLTLLSDPDFVNARRFLSYDDFEEIELHSTLLIDAAGRVHWSQHGGEPFMDFEFLKKEIRHLNSLSSEVETMLGSAARPRKN